MWPFRGETYEITAESRQSLGGDAEEGWTPQDLRIDAKIQLFPSPEQLARTKIDQFLGDAGWIIQDRDEFDRNAALGVAVREFPLSPMTPVVY